MAPVDIHTLPMAPVDIHTLPMAPVDIHTLLTAHVNIHTPDSTCQHTHTTDSTCQHTHTTGGTCQHTHTTDGTCRHTHTTDGTCRHTHTTDGTCRHTHTTDGTCWHTHTTDGTCWHTHTTDGTCWHTHTTDGTCWHTHTIYTQENFSIAHSGKKTHKPYFLPTTKTTHFKRHAFCINIARTSKRYLQMEMLIHFLWFQASLFLFFMSPLIQGFSVINWILTFVSCTQSPQDDQALWSVNSHFKTLFLCKPFSQVKSTSSLKGTKIIIGAESA